MPKEARGQLSGKAEHTAIEQTQGDTKQIARAKRALRQSTRRHRRQHARPFRPYAAQPGQWARESTGGIEQSHFPIAASPERIQTANQDYPLSRRFTAFRAKGAKVRLKPKKACRTFVRQALAHAFRCRSRYAPISVCSVVRKLDILRQHMNSVMQMKMTPQMLENAWLRHLPRLLPLATYITKNAMIGSRMALAA